MSHLRVATDVGGTFTDLVGIETLEDGTVRLTAAKADTTPGAFERGVADAIAASGLDPAAFDFFVHGTTTVINALTERKGVKVGLITTEGFRDSLEIARGNRPDMFNRQYQKPAPFVERYLRREVPGRMDHHGRERSPLDLTGVAKIVNDFKADGVEAVAVSLLHAYANPAHEQAVIAEVRRLWPGVAVVGGAEITREWREYERTNTAVLSAYVQPFAERYLRSLGDTLAERGYAGETYLMQSNCGIDVLDAVARVPITMVESGPASGFWGAAALARALGEDKVLALDIGGTTAKCSLIEGGAVTVKNDYYIERSRKSAGYPMLVPVVDLVEIGNGGGSIAWIDDYDKLHVGPQSAGASPGPAAYGQGGTAPTTTDANLWLGRINKDYFKGGAAPADMDAVGTALDAVAAPLGLGRDELARGIVRIANNNMVNALKLVSLNRGHDPRGLSLIAFGGGGAMHAAALAAEIGVRRVIIPAQAAVFSAWGMMMSDFRRDAFATLISMLEPGNMDTLAAAFEGAEARVREGFARDGLPTEGLEIQRFARLRYQNQEHTIEMPMDGPLTAEAQPALVAAFHDAYERAYTYTLDAKVELVGLHLVAISRIDKPALAEAPVTGRTLAQAEKPRRVVDFAPLPPAEAAIYDGETLEPGMSFDGPAIIEEPGTTIVIRPGDRAEVDRFGNRIITLGESA